MLWTENQQAGIEAPETRVRTECRSTKPDTVQGQGARSPRQAVSVRPLEPARTPQGWSLSWSVNAISTPGRPRRGSWHSPPLAMPSLPAEGQTCCGDRAPAAKADEEGLQEGRGTTESGHPSRGLLAGGGSLHLRGWLGATEVWGREVQLEIRRLKDAQPGGGGESCGGG